MNSENNSIKVILLPYFNKGKSEFETLEGTRKTHRSYRISLKTINKWFEIFRSEACNSIDKESASPKQIFTDEFLIDLINDNPELNLRELATATNTTAKTISRRLKQINRNGERVKYISKRYTTKFTDEYLIGLVNENPDLNMSELAMLANSSESTISIRLKKINSNGERVNYKSKNIKMDNPKLTDELLIDLINENPDLNMNELARLANTTRNTISRKINKINMEEEKVKYVSKKYQFDKLEADEKPYPKQKFTDEFLIDLINENPDLSIGKLAKLADASPTTIKNRIKQINSDGVRANYRKKDLQDLSDESLIKLVNENPGLNMKQLAKLANTTIPFLSKRLKQVNWVDVNLRYQTFKIV